MSKPVDPVSGSLTPDHPAAESQTPDGTAPDGLLSAGATPAAVTPAASTPAAATPAAATSASPLSVGPLPVGQDPVDAAGLGEVTLQQTVAYRGRFLTLRNDTVRLPDGGTAPREFVVHPGASAIVPLADDGRILVERQFRYPMGAVYVEIPAGKRDPGEDFFTTAVRELREEAGVEGRRWAPLTTIDTGIGFTNERIEIFLARDLVQVERGLDEGEFIDLHWLPLGELVDLLRTGRLPDVKTQIAVHWLERLMSGTWPWPEFVRVGPGENGSA